MRNRIKLCLDSMLCEYVIKDSVILLSGRCIHNAFVISNIVIDVDEKDRSITLWTNLGRRLTKIDYSSPTVFAFQLGYYICKVLDRR